MKKSQTWLLPAGPQAARFRGPVLIHGAMVAALFLLATASSGQDGTAVSNPPSPEVDSLPMLRPGEVVEGVIVASDPLVETDRLREYAVFAPALGDEYRLTATQSAKVRIRAESVFSSPYLVVRDRSGAVLDEDESSRFGLLPELVLQLAAGDERRIEIASVFGEPGAYSLRCDVLPPDTLDREDALVATLSYAEEALNRVEQADDSPSAALGTALHRLAFLQNASGDRARAKNTYERAVQVREEVLGAHPNLADSLQGLAGVIKDQGDRAAARPLYERALAIREQCFGPGHLGVAASLAQLAEVLDDPAARPLLERALSIKEQILGPDDSSIGVTAFNLARRLRHLDEWDAAKKLCQRALAIFEQSKGPEDPLTVEAMMELALVHRRQNNYTATIALLERILAIRERTLGKEHSDTTNVLIALAVTHQDLGEYDTAQAYYEQALAIRRKTEGPEHLHTAEIQRNLGTLLEDQGEYEAARPLLEHALGVYQRVLGEENKDTAITMHYLASLLFSQGDYSQSRQLFERTLALTEKLNGPNHSSTAKVLNDLALLLAKQGDYVSAKPLFERALAIRERVLGPENSATSVSLNNLAWVLGQTGEVEAQRRIYERALEIDEHVFGPDHPSLAITLNNLALLLRDQGDLEAAEALMRRALAIHEQALGPEHQDTVENLCNLALILRGQGEFEAARPLMERALTFNEKVLGPEHPATIGKLDNLVGLLLDLGRPDEALAASKRAIESQQAYRDRLVWTLTETERLAFARTLQSSLRLYLSNPLGGVAGAQAADEQYQVLMDWKAQVFRSLTRTRASILASLDDEDRDRVERLRQLQAELSKELFRKQVGDLEAHQALLARLRGECGTLELELTRSAGSTQGARAPSASELRSTLPADSVLLDFYESPHYQPARRDDAGHVLAQGDWTTPRLSVWIVRPGDEAVVRLDLGESAPIETATREFLEAMVAGRGRGAPAPLQASREREPSAADQRLRVLLWEPLAPFVGDAAIVFVSPDGFLGTLPFETLQLADGSLLLEHHAFVYGEDVAAQVVAVRRSSLPAGASDGSNDLPRGPRVRPSLLCVGDVDYGERGDLTWQTAKQPGGEAAAPDPSPLVSLRGGFSNHWTSLPATDLESLAISKLHEERFASATCLTLRGSDATEERVKFELPRFAVVHLATHGFFQPEGLPSMWKRVTSERGEVQTQLHLEQERLVGLMPGLLSGLVLAGANSEPDTNRDDGLLTAEEISFLDLSAVDLVVLSACETALGRSESGEGLLGLRRTFRQAGARTVLGSLWKVDDASTGELMRGFYQRLWLEGQGTLEALHGAQLDLLARNRKEHDGAALPSTWGAFVLDGDWR